MKRKLLITIALVAVVFVAAVLWRVDRFVFGDRMSWAEAQARSQAVSMQQAILVEVRSLERLVFTFNADSFRKEKINWNSLQPYYAIASLGVGTQGDVLTQSIFTRDRSVAANWNADFFNKAIGRLELRPTNGMQIYVKPFVDGNKGHHVALLFVNQAKAYALVGGGELFQSLIDAQKGSLNSFSVVTTSGLTVGHSVPEYVGTLLTEDPVYKGARQSGATQGVGVFDAGDGNKIFGLYDQIPETNLWILSSASMHDLMKGREALMWQFILLGFGLVLVGVAGILFIIVPHEKSLTQLREHVQSLIAGRKDFKTHNMTSEVAEIDELLGALQTAAAIVPVVKQHTITASPVVSAPVVPTAPVDTEKIQRDLMNTKMEAYRSVASALGHEMRAPLTSILGYSQVILSRTEDSEVVSSVDSILRESRSARSVLEKLFTFAGEHDFEKQSMSLETPLARALKNRDSFFSQKGIQLVKEISSETQLPISSEELMRVFDNILMNSVEAMERMSQKEIRVKLFDDEEGVHVEIADTGEGIEPADISKIFDPFFTTRSFQNHTGLGLAVAVGILKEHDADLRVNSERGQGTKMNLLFRRKSTLATAVMPAKKEEIVLPAAMPAPPSAVAEEQMKVMEALNVNEQTLSGAPLDVNIDSLLDLPPAAPEPHEADGNDSGGLTFIDDFLEKKPSAKIGLPPPPPPANIPPVVRVPEAIVAAPVAVPEQDPLEAMMTAPIDADVPVSVVSAPKMPPPPKKKSKLDGFEVDIRKPGKGS